MSKFICEMCDPVDKHDFLLKCIIVGESGVGKTSILNRVTKQDFIVNQISTVGIDFGTLHTKINESKTFNANKDDIELDQLKDKCVDKTNNDKIIKLQIWDCAGQVRFRNIVESYFRQAQVVFFVYDTNDNDSFVHLSTWINTFNEKVGKENYIGCVIGNKCDLDSQTDLSSVEQFCEDNQLECYFMSAKDDPHKIIMKPIEDCVSEAYKRHLNGTMKLSIPIWNNTVDLKGRRKKKQDSDDEGTSRCFTICPVQ